MNMKRKEKIFEKFVERKGEDITLLYLKVDKLHLADSFQSFVATTTRNYGVSLLLAFSSLSNTGKRCINCIGKSLVNIKHKHLFLLIENDIGSGISRSKGDEYILNTDDGFIRIDKKVFESYDNNKNDSFLFQIVNPPDGKVHGSFIECD